MYQAIEYFTDLQDNNYAYNAGDIYPRKNYIPAPERIKQLASSENVRKRPVIQVLVETDENSDKENPETESKSKKHKKKSEPQDTEK